MVSILSDPSLDSTSINKPMIKMMVKYYRQHRMPDKNCLKFAHMPVADIINLFVDNGIIPKLTPADQNKIAIYGLKLYMANHANDLTTIPPGKLQYLPCDTIIICNTQQLTDAQNNKTWTDMLDTGSAVVHNTNSMAGQGLDKTTICPPDCPSKTNHDNMDILSS